jgi:hypothetical protein
MSDEMKQRRFPPPWAVEETQPCFIVRDANQQALAFVYCEDEPGRRTRREFGYGLEWSFDTIRNRIIEARRDLNLISDEGANQGSADEAEKVDPTAAGTKTVS